MSPYRPMPKSKPKPTYSDYMYDYLSAFGDPYDLFKNNYSTLKRAERYAASHTNPKNRIIII